MIRRRRECNKCNKRYTTYERVEEYPLRVVKKDETRVPFDRQNILSGLLKACEKRPVSVDKIEEVVQKIEAEVHKRYDREVSSRDLGELVMAQLRSLDQVAYVRFASVYREFKDVHQFMEELQPMLKEKG